MHIFSKANSYDLLTPNLKNSDNASPIQLVSVRPLTEQERKNLTKKIKPTPTLLKITNQSSLQTD